MEKDNPKMQEMQEQKEEAREKKERKKDFQEEVKNFHVWLLVVLAIWGMAAFFAGRGSAQKEADEKVAVLEENLQQLQQEYMAEQERLQQDCMAEQERVQEEANAKVAKLEKNLQTEYVAKKYALQEMHYEIFSALKSGDIEAYLRHITLMSKFDTLDSEVIFDDVPNLYLKDEEDADEKVMEYVNNLTEIIETYPYAYAINLEVVVRLELVEKDFWEKINKEETFEAMNRLKQKCKENMKLWEESQ